jgi:hypothetical protein
MDKKAIYGSLQFIVPYFGFFCPSPSSIILHHIFILAVLSTLVTLFTSLFQDIANLSHPYVFVEA